MMRKLTFRHGKPEQPQGTLERILGRILDEYSACTEESFTGHPMVRFFREEIPREIYAAGLVDFKTYLVTGSAGRDSWAAVPWVCIFDRELTASRDDGACIAYQLSKDRDTLYLTFNQNGGKLWEEYSRQDAVQLARRRAARIASDMNSRGFASDENIRLGAGLTELEELYEKGTVFYKAYHRGRVPSEAVLREDFGKMLDIYREYAGKQETGEVPAAAEDAAARKTVDRIKAYIAAQGFSYEEGLVENLCLSLKAKPFVILAGISGTGKTRLVRLFAEACGATRENGRYRMVSVRPDWADATDLFGHVDLNGRFHPGPILDFIKQAEQDGEKPYFLCLDEMNLARVEYYFSDVLSVMETRTLGADGRITTDPLVEPGYYGADADAAERYGTVTLPENLYIVGTVNMDETTFPFSRKVLDRANTLEFSHVDLIPQNWDDFGNREATELPNEFLKADFLLLAHCADHRQAVEEYCQELQSLNRILQKANAHVGYRVRDEIVFYLLANRKMGLLKENEAMDNAIMQKILPRFQGSGGEVKNMLCALFQHCAGDFRGLQAESGDLGRELEQLAREPGCRYRRCAEKLAFMVRRYETDGFTSYWL